MSYTNNYLRFTAEQAGAKLKFAKFSAQATAVPNLSISLNGAAWTHYENESYIILENVGDYVMFRSETPRTTYRDGVALNTWSFVINSGRIAASGDVRTILRYDIEPEELSTWAFYRMFYDCTALTRPPELLATKINGGGYYSMFQTCSAMRLDRTRICLRDFSDANLNFMFWNGPTGSVVLEATLEELRKAPKSSFDCFAKHISVIYVRPEVKAAFTADPTVLPDWFAGKNLVALNDWHYVTGENLTRYHDAAVAPLYDGLDTLQQGITQISATAQDADTRATRAQADAQAALLAAQAQAATDQGTIDLTPITSRLTTAEQTIAAHEARLATAETSISNNHSDYLTMAQAQMADEQRITQLERALTALNARLTALETPSTGSDGDDESRPMV